MTPSLKFAHVHRTAANGQLLFLFLSSIVDMDMSYDFTAASRVRSHSVFVCFNEVLASGGHARPLITVPWALESGQMIISHYADVETSTFVDRPRIAR
ncbi:hypothetical protein OF83DRAFT_787939 [Amylostereum chailletii]|nr:hypothetical protein OF83DRAFT_787939 [Amylostereum chailletii]